MTDSKLRVAGMLPVSFINGEGMRYVVFVQGCEHHCPGCHNPDTWDPAGGEDVSVRELALDIERRWLNDGLTLSGGEPFLQEDACMALLDALPDDLDVWVYTGYEYEEIKDRPLAKRADVLVTGPYVEALRCEGKMYGSSNQEIHRRERNDVG